MFRLWTNLDPGTSDSGATYRKGAPKCKDKRCSQSMPFIFCKFFIPDVDSKILPISSCGILKAGLGLTERSQTVKLRLSEKSQVLVDVREGTGSHDCTSSRKSIHGSKEHRLRNMKPATAQNVASALIEPIRSMLNSDGNGFLPYHDAIVNFNNKIDSKQFTNLYSDGVEFRLTLVTGIEHEDEISFIFDSGYPTRAPSVELIL